MYRVINIFYAITLSAGADEPFHSLDTGIIQVQREAPFKAKN
jgi:hypothetical protein